MQEKRNTRHTYWKGRNKIIHICRQHAYLHKNSQVSRREVISEFSKVTIQGQYTKSVRFTYIP